MAQIDKMIIKSYYPFFIFFSFSITSILLFLFGPIDYQVTNISTLLIYLIAVHVGVFIGYAKGISKQPHRATSIRRIHYYASIFCFVALAYIIAVLRMNAVFGFSLISGLSNPGGAREVWDLKIGTFYSYLTNWLEIFNIPLLSLTFAFWNKLRRIHKFMGIFLLIFIVLNGVATGARHCIWAYFFIVSISLALGIFSNRIKIKWRTYISGAILIVVLCTVYFSFIALARSGYSADYKEFLKNNMESTTSDRLLAWNLGEIKMGHPLLTLFPPSVGPGIIQGYRYLTHGYWALAKALEKSFVGIAYGFGQSAFGTRIATAIWGEDFKAYSYPYRLLDEDSYPLSNWVTSYTWIASDVTFTGSVIVLSFFGWILGSTWKSALYSDDPIAAILCCYMSICFNQMPLIFFAQDPVSFFTFYGLILIFIFRKKTRGESLVGACMPQPLKTHSLGEPI